MAVSTALQVLVSPFLGVVFDNLSSLIQKEIGLVLGVNKELEKLFNTFSTIRDVLEDAEVKQIDDKPINNWLRKLKDLTYETDDILDECATEALMPDSEIVKSSSCNIQVPSSSDTSCFNFKSIMFRRSIGKRIKNLIEEFDKMADLRSKFHLNAIPENVESRRKEQRETSSFLSEPQVYGRKGDTEHITNLLLEGGEEVSGKLEIKGLQHVKDLKESRKANLMRKKSLHKLKLFWSEENNDNMEVGEEGVTKIGEGLQPHPNLRVLDINYYNGLTFPSWMSHSCLPNLVKISLVGCRRCEHLPPLGGLAFLEILKISEMDSVKCIGDEFYGSSLFPSLRKFEICKMPNLEEWYAPSSKEEENMSVFSSLVSLTLEGCPKLRTLPTTLLSDLRELTLGGECNEIMLESISLVQVIGCLQKLEIKSFNRIETLPKVLLDNLPSTLTQLHIRDCKELVCLPQGVMQNLTSLKSFHISECSSLKYLPELGNRNNSVMTSVSELEIYDCPELEFLPDDFQDLTSLQSLVIGSLPQMTCLPEGLQQVAGTLKYLRIMDCSGLTSLSEWMDKFTSLQVLFIDDSENLKVLPEEVLHLTSLILVRITDCHPDLHRRYAKETGEDWHKIAHIPDLTIGESTPWKIRRHGSGKMKKMKCINYNNNSITSCFSSSSSSSSTNQ